MAAEGVSSFSWPPFEAAYFFSEFTVRASTPLLQLLVLVSRAGSWQKHSQLAPYRAVMTGVSLAQESLAVSLSTVGC